MIAQQTTTLLTVAELGSFTRAAETLSLTQPAVSQQVAAVENEFGAKIFIRGRGDLRVTPEGEIILRYARRMKALDAELRAALSDHARRLTRLRIGITHTAESGLITEVIARLGRENEGMIITIITDTIKNLYTKLEDYELDLVIADNRPTGRELRSMLLDTDHLLCVMSPEHPLARRAMVTIPELRREKLLLRLPSSATRVLFESHLEAIGESIDSFSVLLELDSVPALKDLIRKNLGISILPRSSCADELSKGKLAALPIENLGMIRETNLVCRRDFDCDAVMRRLMEIYAARSRADARE